jgi:protein arginine kinase activator
MSGDTPMKCEKCNDNNAVIHFTQVRDGKVVSYNLCQDCAEKLGMKGANFDSINQPAFAPEAKSEVLNELAQGAEPGKADVCPFCGSTMDDIKSSGRLGCSQCYFTFENQVDVLLRRIQGSSFHVGRRTSKPESQTFNDQMMVRELKKKLNDAVKREDYEKAAKLRDEIQSIEKRMEVS